MQFDYGHALKHVLILIVMTACAGTGSSSIQTPTPPQAQATSTAIPVLFQQTPSPTEAVEEPSISTLNIWWPDDLAPSNRPEITALIGEQIEAFAQSEDRMIDVEFRRRRYLDRGGIMTTLRSASTVAPGALPDITLMRRSEMLAAADEGLIYPLEGLIVSSVLGDLFDSSIALGQVEGEIYGLAYMVDLTAIVYHAELDEDGQPITERDWSFEAVLAREQDWAFPASPNSGLSSIVYAQYLDAGGSSLDVDDPSLDETALFRVFLFYETAVEAGLFDEDTVDHSTIDDYAPSLLAGAIPAGVLSSTTYLAEKSENDGLLFNTTPTESGGAGGVLDGWMWVITTNNADQQSLAADFLSWMMDVNRQSAFANTILMLPSRTSSLQRFQDGLINISLMDSMLDNAVIPMSDGGGLLVRNIQSAFLDVLAGDITAEEAVAVVVEQ